MRKIKAFIERGSDGTYGVYIDLAEKKLTHGIIGEGQTVDEAVSDFRISYREMRELYKDEKKRFEEVEFVFVYDVASFLRYYSNILSLAGLERITGINQGQLSHYLNGVKNPRPETVKKIEDGIHRFANDLSQVRLT